MLISTVQTHGEHDVTIRQVHFLAKDQTQVYLEAPFTVSGPVERIEVRYDYERSGGKTVVDIGLLSPTRIVGWSGGARSSFAVGLETATPGYLAGPIPEGEWSVLLAAYRTVEEGCKVDLEIRLVYKHSRWLKGDLHTHSVHSDGSYTIAEAIAHSKERGLSFLALTDHNNASQNRYALAADERLVLIPGVELTSYRGHANLLGHPDALVDFRVLTPEKAAEVLRIASDRGAFVSLNHPFDEGCPWELGFDLPYDAIEVWNGPWRPINRTAVDWWQDQLAAGRKIVAIGGSDTHRPDPYVVHGRPTTHVRSESATAGGILEGMRRGRVVLSFDPDETFIDLTIGSAGVGDELTVSGPEPLPLSLNVSGAKGDRIMLWSDRGVEQEWTTDEGGLYEFDVPSDRLFYRVEAYRFLPDWKLEIMTCLTNPIYLRERPADEDSRP